MTLQEYIWKEIKRALVEKVRGQMYIEVGKELDKLEEIKKKLSSEERKMMGFHTLEEDWNSAADYGEIDGNEREHRFARRLVTRAAREMVKGGNNG